MIQFLLNQRLHRESRLDPNTTVLTWLRRHQQRCGTKEGCASGDCGACTVVLAEPAGDRLRYRTVNACITLVSALDGKQLITVEDLKQRDQLHPVQQAMVDCHASQCGFCTPGFVMSLFALQKQHGQGSTEQALAGNLCRCTGYRPIVAAADHLAAQGTKDDQFDQAEAQTLARLNALAPAGLRQLSDNGQRCLMPDSLAALAEAFLAEPHAQLVAGGTDLALAITQRSQHFPLLIALNQVPELRTIEQHPHHVSIGAAVPLTDCLPVLREQIPAFADLMTRFASQQIRNQGTLGGSLANASPIGDAAPALLALNASLELRRGAETRTLPLDDFFLSYRQTALQPGEFIARILIPHVTTSLKIYKVSKRQEDDISAVCAAFSLDIRHGVVQAARLAYGGMAAIPARARHTEQALVGQPWQLSTLELACRALADDFTPISDFRAGSAYRLLVAQNLLRRAYFELSTPHQPIKVTDYV
ncbi:xanthine dehydrogenase small subunit [Nissabacter archeti]|uniref:Xanthine dehydrogenase small subunit n=1 Tax=Nissabacter archeti TaxID=1917880 RepID=A0ABS5JN38_9GAMM|nr:xanthine dehydrogenase small subunit [Nissabacter archeti]MBS0971376.1 xanthine dehydrogenase small subunit [Nissabacter archeti]